MVSTLLLTTFVQSTIWSPVTNVDYLADRTDKDGVVAVTFDRHAKVLDGSGKVEKDVVVKPGQRVLRYTGDSIVVLSPPVAAGNEPPERVAPWIAFGQGKSTVILANGTTVMTDRTSYSLAGMGRWDLIAVRNDGKAICSFTFPMSPPIVNEYMFNGYSWGQSRDTMSPEVEGIGFIAPYAGYNDARYISDDRIVFLGGMDSKLSPENVLSASRMKPFLGEGDIQMDNDSNFHAFLYVFDTDYRTTFVAKRFGIKTTGEMRGPRFGLLALAHDMKHLYVRCYNGIARLDSDKMVKYEKSS